MPWNENTANTKPNYKQKPGDPGNPPVVKPPYKKPPPGVRWPYDGRYGWRNGS